MGWLVTLSFADGEQDAFFVGEDDAVKAVTRALKNVPVSKSVVVVHLEALKQV